MPTEATVDLRVLILAPIGRDGALTVAAADERRRAVPRLRATRRELCQEIRQGAGAVLLTEEALADPSIDELAGDAADPAGLVGRLAAAVRRRRSEPGDDPDAAHARGDAQRHAARPADPRDRRHQHRPRRAARAPPAVRAARRARRARVVASGRRARPRRRGARQPAEGRVPGHAVARAAHAAQRHPRLGVAAARSARRGGPHPEGAGDRRPATRSRRRS